MKYLVDVIDAQIAIAKQLGNEHDEALLSHMRVKAIAISEMNVQPGQLLHTYTEAQRAALEEQAAEAKRLEEQKRDTAVNTTRNLRPNEKLYQPNTITESPQETAHRENAIVGELGAEKSLGNESPYQPDEIENRVEGTPVSDEGH